MQSVTFQDIANHYTFSPDVESDDNKYVVCMTVRWDGSWYNYGTLSQHIFVSDTGQLLVLNIINPHTNKAEVTRPELHNVKITQEFIAFSLKHHLAESSCSRENLDIPHIHWTGITYWRDSFLNVVKELIYDYQIENILMEISQDERYIELKKLHVERTKLGGPFYEAKSIPIGDGFSIDINI